VLVALVAGFVAASFFAWAVGPRLDFVIDRSPTQRRYGRR